MEEGGRREGGTRDRAMGAREPSEEDTRVKWRLKPTTTPLLPFCVPQPTPLPPQLQRPLATDLFLARASQSFSVLPYSFWFCFPSSLLVRAVVNRHFAAVNKWQSPVGRGHGVVKNVSPQTLSSTKTNHNC